MLESVAGPLQAISWPLVGAALVLLLGRLLPDLLRRVLASVAALLALLTLWSLRSDAGPAIQLFWRPVNLFRSSPTLSLDALGLMVGLTVSGVTAATLLGIRGPGRRQTVWQALLLVALAGCLLAIMGANLLTLLLGSALLDLALIALALPGRERAAYIPWRFVVPGMLSTLVLMFAALEMDVLVGSTLLSARQMPTTILALLSAAGLLRLLVFPLHPRGLNSPEAAATLLLSLAGGTYLLARAHALSPLPGQRPWALALGAVGLVAGGLLAWLGALGTEKGQSHPLGAWALDWPSAAIHQTAYVLLFVTLLAAPLPWPLLSLSLALGLLAIWWDANRQPLPHPTAAVEGGATNAPQHEHPGDGPGAGVTSPQDGDGDGSGGLFAPLREWAKQLAAPCAPLQQRWRNSWLARRGAILLPMLALLSLGGAPLTVGGRGRWSFYASLLQQRQSALLIAALAADTLFSAALWLALAATLKLTTWRRLGAGRLVAAIVLAVFIVSLGVAPNLLSSRLNMTPFEPPSVSIWGLGLVFVLPWLVGGWLARGSRHAARSGDSARRLVELDWLYAAAGWLGRQILALVGWLGLVGEGDGWWGWALIILALGGMVFALR